MKTLSFVIPCYGSEKTLISVVSDIQELMKQQLATYSYEIILVNDHSPDNTYGVIKQLAYDDSEHIIGIDLAKNFGQHSALMAGFREVSGDYIIALDDDGQTPPEATVQLLNKLLAGYDVVYASYDNKQHSLFRNLGSKINDYMAKVMLEKPNDLYLSSFFIARRFIIDEIVHYTCPYPYLQGLVLRTTRNIANTPVIHQKRESGTSGYTFSKLLRLWMNGFTAFSVLPLRFASLCGLFCASIGFLGIIIVFVRKIIMSDRIPLGYSALMTTILFVGGIIMLMLGMIGEYVGRIYISLNNSPQYVIRDATNKKNKSDSSY